MIFRMTSHKRKRITSGLACCNLNRYLSKVSEIIHDYPKLAADERIKMYSEKVLPNMKALLSELNNVKESIPFAMKLRDDTQYLIKTNRNDDLRELDKSLMSWLGTVFSLDSIYLERVTFEKSSGTLLELVAKGEAVHSVRSLSELKRRLGYGRRCFAYLHPSLPNDPLTFINVALTPELATSLAYINKYSTENVPTHAMFYSVNSPHSSLSGLELATKIIKNSAKKVAYEFPSITVFSTLSPIPGFNDWLKSISQDTSSMNNILQLISSELNDRFPGVDNYKKLLTIISDVTKNNDWAIVSSKCDNYKNILLLLCYQYIVNEKYKESNLPLDPVARFHLRNGASVHSINWMGNPSSAGLHSSCGLMVNYLYDLSSIEERSERFRIENGYFDVGELAKKSISK